MTDRGAIWVAFALNITLAVIELIAGFWARSVALLADAADFVEDSTLYLLILLVDAAKPQVKARFGYVLAALMAGPGLAAAWQVADRIIHPGLPGGGTIWAVSTLALLANLGTVAALMAARQRSGGGQGLGFRAAWLSSRNDAFSNLAMIGAGVAVSATGQGWPDLVVGLGVAALHLSGGIAIWRAARDEAARAKGAQG